MGIKEGREALTHLLDVGLDTLVGRGTELRLDRRELEGLRVVALEMGGRHIESEHSVGQEVRGYLVNMKVLKASLASCWTSSKGTWEMQW